MSSNILWAKQKELTLVLLKIIKGKSLFSSQNKICSILKKASNLILTSLKALASESNNFPSTFHAQSVTAVSLLPLDLIFISVNCRFLWFSGAKTLPKKKSHQRKLHLKTLTIIEQTIYHYVMQIYDPKVLTPFSVITPPLFTHIFVKNMPVNT